MLISEKLRQDIVSIIIGTPKGLSEESLGYRFSNTSFSEKENQLISLLNLADGQNHKQLFELLNFKYEINSNLPFSLIYFLGVFKADNVLLWLYNNNLASFSNKLESLFIRGNPIMNKVLNLVNNQWIDSSSNQVITYDPTTITNNIDSDIKDYISLENELKNTQEFTQILRLQNLKLTDDRIKQNFFIQPTNSIYKSFLFKICPAFMDPNSFVYIDTAKDLSHLNCDKLLQYIKNLSQTQHHLLYIADYLSNFDSKYYDQNSLKILSKALKYLSNSEDGNALLNFLILNIIFSLSKKYNISHYPIDGSRQLFLNQKFWTVSQEQVSNSNNQKMILLLLLGAQIKFSVFDNNRGNIRSREYNILQQYIKSKNYEIVNFILNLRAIANDNKDLSENYYFYYSMNFKDPRIFNLLLTFKEDINDTANNRTLLFSALENNYPDIAEEILKYPSANIDLGVNDLAPIHLACLKGYDHIVKLLLAHGADSELINCKGNTPLMDAAEHGNHSCLIVLVEYSRSNLDQRNYNDDTALHLALKNRHYHIAHALLEAGADPKIVNTQGKTALDILYNQQILFRNQEYNNLYNTLVHDLISKTYRLNSSQDGQSVFIVNGNDVSSSYFNCSFINSCVNKHQMNYHR